MFLAIKAINKMLKFYRNMISPFLHAFAGPGYGCRFVPTCSSYFSEAVLTHGALKGSVLGFFRICRCQPFGRQGYDPVPTRSE